MITTAEHREVVDLANFTRAGARIFAGHRWGRSARKAAQLDEHDINPNTVVCVQIPIDAISINSSFFRGMFGASIRKLGPEFRDKYKFETMHDRNRHLLAKIDANITDVLRGPTRLRFGPDLTGPNPGPSVRP